MAIGDTPNVVIALAEVALWDRYKSDHTIFHYALDIQMQILFGARERTRSEWASLLIDAGFKAPTYVATRGFSQFVMSAVDL